MPSEAQKRASKKYKKNMKSLTIWFYPKDFDVYDWLKQQEEPAKQKIISLVREEMERG